MKARIILNSLADLPADALALAASVPGRAVETTKQILALPVRATRRQIRKAQQRSAHFADGIYARATLQMEGIRPWPRGGLNE